jgi:hypothetical protein
MDEHDLVKLHSTPSQIATFIDSVVWADMRREINVWITHIQQAIEVVEGVDELRKYQGRAEACRNFLALPEQMLAALEVDNERIERDNESTEE